MKIEPILTEKTLAAAKDGVYTFRCGKGATKLAIKRVVNEIFGVHVQTVRTLSYKKGEKKNIRGRKVVTSAYKKTLVTLAAKETISLFEAKKK